MLYLPIDSGEWLSEREIIKMPGGVIHAEFQAAETNEIKLQAELQTELQDIADRLDADDLKILELSDALDLDRN